MKRNWVNKSQEVEVRRTAFLGNCETMLFEVSSASQAIGTAQGAKVELEACLE